MYQDVIMAGFGGQGILLMGNLLSYAAMNENFHVTYMPAYGVEMRGGVANCTVVISDEEIGSPVIGRPQSLIIMNYPSLLRFQDALLPGGKLFLNTSLVDEKEVTRKDISVHPFPFNDAAADLGNGRLANMVALGAYLQVIPVVPLESINQAMEETLDKKYHKMIPGNIKALKKGAELGSIN